MVKATGLIVFLISMIGPLSWSQPGHWQSPIPGTVLLSGTFGELRGSHFHAGADIKPNVPGNQDVLAVADGFVKEIRISGGSYGNALLLQHQDGYQSLYGHLSHFIPELDSILYAYQYAQKKFDVTVALDSTQFPVTQGMVIATMGNTGYSFGRHLHLEVRRPSGTMYNPLLMIPALQDDTPPQFRNLKINYHDDTGREYKEKIIAVKSLGRGRYTAGDLRINSLTYSLATDVVDLHKMTSNHNGIYRLEMYRDSSLVYSYMFDSLSREDRKFYPEHIDYITSPATQAIYHNLRYQKKDIKNQMIDLNSGLYHPSPFQTQNYIIKATDFQGNSSNLSFSIRRVEHPEIDYTHMYNYVIETNRSNRVNLDQYTIIFPPHTFRGNQQLYLFEEKIVRDNEEINFFHMSGNELPMYKKPMLILNSKWSETNKSKWTLARCSDDNYRAIPTLRDKNRFAARIDQFSDYCLALDTLAPVIKFQPQSGDLWYFTLSDNMHPFSSLNYKASVNGQWALVQADDKNDRLIFQDFERFKGPEIHQFRLEVTDGCGNKSVFDRSFR